MNENKIDQALEMVRCADCNLDNISKLNPHVLNNPMFIIVKAQLASAIDMLEGGDGELKF